MEISLTLSGSQELFYLILWLERQGLRSFYLQVNGVHVTADP